MANLTSLIGADDGPQFDLPDDLRERYGGSFGVGRPRLIANFVSTIDGVVAIPSVPRSSQLIADGDDDDRFVMALLRAVSDAIVIGSGNAARLTELACGRLRGPTRQRRLRSPNCAAG